MPTTIHEIDSIYACSKHVTIAARFVKYEELYAFSSALNEFTRLLGDAVEDEYWTSFTSRLKRFRFDICAAPLTQQYLEEYANSVCSALNGHLQDCDLIYPDLSLPAKSLLQQLTGLAKQKLSHLLDEVVELGRENQRRVDETALLIKESRLIPHAENALQVFPVMGGWKILHPISLKDSVCYQLLVVIGPPRWFPEYIFSAPRASNICIVNYNWIQTKWKPKPVFIRPIKRRLESKNAISHENDRPSWIEPGEILPTIDLSRITARAANEISNKEEEYVEAQLFLLEGGRGVFLEADKTASVLAIDPDEDARKRVKRIHMRDIEPEIFILLRTAGGGDYIVPVADRIMGNLASALRTKQRLWKSRLRSLVKEQGIKHAVKQLQMRGSSKANDTNVRNWMSERGIKTEEFADFKAILDLVGLGTEAKSYWQAMETIDRAHQKAGFHIRKLLLEQVNKSDLGKLKRDGIMSFELPDKDAGGLAAFRVQTMSSEVIKVVPSRIGDSFELEEA